MTKMWDDTDPTETKEWLDALASLLKHEGVERAAFIMEKLLQKAAGAGVGHAYGL
jgi:pyruvate dehydrogenase E1 component